ncbi:hypothetical protein ElyMa_001384900 [Elysia marginata]|uniref:Uncharacterized protein n=1 Tax=Elysia marginata TaxID=1093978 RepID=A0AAV4IQW7_9GAST|nr:hypothetical protein ElyMa_001384900 [Elysia marginata]
MQEVSLWKEEDKPVVVMGTKRKEGNFSTGVEVVIVAVVVLIATVAVAVVVAVVVIVVVAAVILLAMVVVRVVVVVVEVVVTNSTTVDKLNAVSLIWFTLQILVFICPGQSSSSG